MRCDAVHECPRCGAAPAGHELLDVTCPFLRYRTCDECHAHGRHGAQLALPVTETTWMPAPKVPARSTVL